MSDKTAEVLLPCPFCGGIDMRFAVEKGAGSGMWHEGQDIWYMNCYNCGVRFPGMYAEHGRKSLIEKWNTRAALPVAAPAVPEGMDLIPRRTLTMAIHRLRSVANGNALPSLADVVASELEADLLRAEAQQAGALEGGNQP